MGCSSHVPGWHERMLELQKAGRLQVVGIIQEQHPDRARLSLQWKSMSWALLVDSLDLLQVSGVPITLGLDEHGVVRSRKPTIDIINEIIDTTFASPGEETPALEGTAPPGTKPAELEVRQGLTRF